LAQAIRRRRTVQRTKPESYTFAAASDQADFRPSGQSHQIQPPPQSRKGRKVFAKKVKSNSIAIAFPAFLCVLGGSAFLPVSFAPKVFCFLLVELGFDAIDLLSSCAAPHHPGAIASGVNGAKLAAFGGWMASPSTLSVRLQGSLRARIRA
jgi:hypothetical protein